MVRENESVHASFLILVQPGLMVEETRLQEKWEEKVGLKEVKRLEESFESESQSLFGRVSGVGRKETRLKS